MSAPSRRQGVLLARAKHREQTIQTLIARGLQQIEAHLRAEAKR